MYIFWRVTIIASVILFLELISAASIQLIKGLKIEGALIVDRHSKAHRYIVRHNHVESFIKEFRAHASKIIPNEDFVIEQWPSVFTSNCPKLPGHPKVGYRAEGAGKNEEGFERGHLLAHTIIWWDFLKRCKQSNVTQGVLMVFEDDVFPRVENFVEVTIQEIEKMSTDVLFLGWCFGDTNQNKRPPHCSHAYAVSISGLHKLLDQISPCGASIDVQLINLASTQTISWAFASNSTFLHAGTNYEAKKSLAKLGGYYDIGSDALTGDGIFAQRSFAAAMVEDTTTAPELRKRHL